MLADVLHWFPTVKDLILGVLVDWVLKGLQSLHFTHWLSGVCVGLTQASTTKAYQHCWKEWAGWCA